MSRETLKDLFDLLEVLEKVGLAQNKSCQEEESSDDWKPPYELAHFPKEGEDIITIIAPGASAQDFTVKARNGKLIISYIGKETYITDCESNAELTYNKPWELVFIFSSDDEQQGVKVSYTAGILRVIVPKRMNQAERNYRIL